jgi:glycosyltransferase involved in cell wall biosynthesis
VKHLLFVNPLQQLNTPRSIRITPLTEYLKEKYNVHLLYFDLGVGNGLEFENVSYHKIRLSSRLNSKRLVTDKENLLVKIRYKIRNQFQLINDPFVFETKNLTDEIKKLHHEYRFAKIILSASPYATYLISRIQDANKLYIYDVGDPLFRNSGLKGSHNPKFMSVEKAALETAGGVIVTNEATRDFFLKTYQIAPHRISIIPQGISSKFFKPHTTERQNKTDGHLKLIYAGRFYPEIRDPRPLLNAVDQYNESHEESMDIDIYGGQGVDMTKHLNQHIRKISPVDQHELIERMSNYDVNVFIDNRNSIQTPGKIYELLASKKPLLFICYSFDSATYHLIKDCKGVYPVLNKTDEILGTLEKIHQDIGRGMHEVKCDFDLTQYSWASLSEKYVEFLESLPSLP